MQPDRRGIGELNALLLASLALHLVVVGAVPWREAPRSQGTGMVLEYLETGGSREEKGQAAAREVPAPVRTATDKEGAPGTPRVPARPVAALQAAPQNGSGPAAPVSTVWPAGSRREEARATGTASAVFSGIGNAPKTEGASNPSNKDGASAPLPGAGAPSAAAGTALRGNGAELISAASTGASVGASGTTPGREGTASPGRAAYLARLKSLIEAHKAYPLAARKSGREGSCQRRFVVGRDGSLKRVESVTSCGHPFLDGAATQAVTGVGRFPPLPAEYPGAEESFTVPITFTLSGR